MIPEFVIPVFVPPEFVIPEHLIPAESSPAESSPANVSPAIGNSEHRSSSLPDPRIALSARANLCAIIAPHSITHSVIWTAVSIVWFTLALIVSLPHSQAQTPEPVDPTDDRFFNSQIAPLFEKHCIECHNAERREGELALDSREGFFRGGESGPVYLPATPDKSPLIVAVQTTDSAPAMPKGRPALSAAQVAALSQWLTRGAHWSQGKRLSAQPAIDSQWWSLQPLTHSIPPTQPTHNPLAPHQSRTRVDAYMEQARQQQGLAGSAPATRGELLRRLSFDLTGLPPTFEEVQRFEADDRPDAVERLVDRLLASPAYGERWARHWLDVVHYGETHGYDKDKMRPSAWPYRDYVIRSFNSDKPIVQFAREQIAGDCLWPDSSDAIEAVGFLSAGPWDFIGHAEVPESKLDGRIARHLDRDDMVQNTFLTFQSLTVGCAQCHDHKFDPISQKEYYGLQAVFAALDRADRKYYRDPELQSRFAEQQSHERKLTGRLAQIQQQVKELGGSSLADLDKRIADIKPKGGHRPAEHGYHSAIAKRADDTKWVQVDLGKPTEIKRIEWVACYDDFNGIGAGFGAPLAWRIQASHDPAFEQAAILLTERTSHRKNAKNPGVQPQIFEIDATTARFVRFTATELALRKDDYILALAELRIFDAAGRNVALGKTVTALDSIEAPVRWSRSNLVDGKAPSDATNSAEYERRQADRAALLDRVMPASLRQEEQQLSGDLQAVRKSLSAFPPASTVYCATIHYGQGAFAGTGPSGGRPRSVRIHPRGDVSRDGPIAQPMALECLSPRVDSPTQDGAKYSALRADLGTAESSDAERRAALANWLTHNDNPLFWRSMANRLWAYHFTRGIVDTPNDFGRMGSLPSHPELLDSLALELREHQSLKQLHREMLLSATYQQSSRLKSLAEFKSLESDPNNRWLARSSRRRLEAEAIRDAMLSVAGLLRREMGGPSYQDFVIEHPEHSPHYEYRLHDPQDPNSMRRSIYRFIARSQTQPLMTLLDCADPSMQVDVRSQSNSATQALALLNNAFTLMAAHRWADRVAEQFAAEALADGTSLHDADRLRAIRQQMIASMFAQALGRAAAPDELQLLMTLADASPAQTAATTAASSASSAERVKDERVTDIALTLGQGLDQVARAIFNMNEFVYVD